MFKTLKIVAVLLVTLACVFVSVLFFLGPGISRYRPNAIRRYPADIKSPTMEDTRKNTAGDPDVSDPELIPTDQSRDS